MATRHLKRLQQAAAAPQAAASDPREDSTEEEADEEPSTAPFNPFDLLSDEEDDAAQAGDSSGSDDDEPQPSAPPPPPPPKPAASGGGPAKGKSRKSKSKGKGKPGAEDVEASEQPAGLEEDIDALLQELNLRPAAAGGDAAAASSSGAGGPGQPPLLGVAPKALRGDAELRRIFGSGVIDAVDRQDAADGGGGPAGGRQRRYGHQPRNMPRRRAMKKGWLVAPQEHWPPFEGGLSMRPAGTGKDGRQLYEYVHSPAYAATQAAFEQCQASHDPNTIAALLQRAPYHVDALLAMHDLYRHMGDTAFAEEVLARALYALEAAWHPSFNITTGSCRLDFEVPENRPLFTSLYRRMQALSRQGCHQSALELGKLLLALEPEDPLGVLLQLDYLALRAGQYAWLRRLAAEYEADASLALLPNFAYGVALAALQQEAQRAQLAAAAGARRGGGAAEGGEAEEAGEGRTLLLQAVLLHPQVVPLLVAKLRDKGAAREGTWDALNSRKLFAQAGDGGSGSLAHLTSLFAERSAELWRSPAALGWLAAAAAAAADTAEGRPPSWYQGVGAQDWGAVRAEAFPASSANEYRHLRLADFSDTVNALPREELQAAMAAGGVAGADDALEEQLAAMQVAMAEAQAQAARGRQMSEEELRNANPLLVLLQSFLPWFDGGQAPEYGRDEQEGPQGQGGPPQ